MKIEVPDIKAIRLANGAQFFPINRGHVPALKLELTFPAGRPYEIKKGVANATLQMIKGGSAKKSAVKLAESFDYWGSSLNFDFYVDTVGIKLFALEKYMPHVLKQLIELLKSPAFPQSELKLYKRQQKEKLKSDESRGDVMAYRTFTERLFGTDHPYGYNSSEESIDAITREDLVLHYQTCYNLSACKIFLSGCFTSETEKLVMDALGQIPSGPMVSNSLKLKKPNATNGFILIEKSDAVQTSLRIGRRMFPRKHPDYVAMFVFNSLLGGYYGSRLMQNLREKKGLTYHIYSSLDAFMYDGYFLISTEVDEGRSRVAFNAIQIEIEKLKNKPVSHKELNTLKNYLSGSFLNYFENAFGFSELIRLLSIEGGRKSFIELINGIQAIQPTDIQKIAQKYFDPSDITLVAVGKFNTSI